MFALSGPADAQPASRREGPVLAVKAIGVSPLFAGKSFVYRLDENQYERDPYAEFLVMPERIVGAAVQGHLRHSGLYREVIEETGVLKPNQWMELQVRELYGDYRAPKLPSAVLTLKFTIYETGRDSLYRTLVEKAYRRQVPLKGTGPSALVAGWDHGLNEIMAELSQDLTAAGPGANR